MPKPIRRLSHSTPPSVTSSRRVPDDRYSTSRDSTQRDHRDLSRTSRTRAPSVDSQDTYYDPRDKYYLSGDDNDYGWLHRGRSAQPRNARSSSESSRTPSPPGYRAPRSSASSNPYMKGHHNSGHRRTVSEARYHGGGRSSSSKSHYPPSRRRHESHQPQQRRRRSPSPSSSLLSSSSSRSRSRSRSPFSSRTSKSSSAKTNKSHNSKQQPNSPKPKSTLSQAAHNAFEAGAIAALRLRNDPSPWLGAHKGGQIAAAALGAAVVDTFVSRRLPTRKGGLRHTVARQAAQMVIGGLVKSNAGGGGSSRGGGGGGGGEKGSGGLKGGGKGGMVGGRGRR